MSSAQVVATNASKTPSTASRPAPEVVMSGALGFVVSSCLQTATRLEIPDLIHSGTRKLGDLAAKVGLREDSLFRILRVLEMAGFVTESGRQYQLTEAGSLLRIDAPGSMRYLTQFLTDPLHYKCYTVLTDSLQRGEVPFESLHGAPIFAWFARPENRDEAELFHNAMVSLSGVCIPAFVEAYDFTQFHTIIDVGGGLGGIIRAILKKCPEVKGVIAEMPEVVRAATEAIAEDGLNSRCSAVASDFFQSIPSGGDAYFMKHILHDWNDEDSTKILKNIRSVIPANGKLLLAEAVLPNDGSPHPGKLFDIEMLVFLKGKERTEPEWRKLLSGAGFSLNRVIATNAPLELIEADPV